MDKSYKEVYFDKYCQTCEWFKLSEVKDPCNDCLQAPVNLHTHKPTKWEEKK